MVTQYVKSVFLFVVMSSAICLSFTLSALEEPKPVTINEDFNGVKGSFSQYKSIKPLKRPFQSSGSFIYIPNKGLQWHTQQPVDSVKLFTNHGVYKVDEQGELQKEAQIDNDFFLALFAADEQKLKTYFIVEEVNSNQNNQPPCLALTPKNGTMKSLFKRINLCVSKHNSGAKVPSKIELIDTKGNETRIQLQLLSEQISPEELSYFE